MPEHAPRGRQVVCALRREECRDADGKDSARHGADVFTHGARGGGPRIVSRGADRGGAAAAWRVAVLTPSPEAARDMNPEPWPALPLADWLPTYATLHRWTQIVGKTRLGLAPFENHWWNCTLYVTTRGLTTSTMPYRSGGGGGGVVEVEFDFLDDALLARTDGGETR